MSGPAPTPARKKKPPQPAIAASDPPALIAEENVGSGEQELKTAAIARLAYSYWEARGSQGGSAEEDWLRAEHELKAR
jgi:hypothetical protein